MAQKAFDFTDFVREHQITSLVSELVDVVSNVENEQVQARVADFRTKYKLGVQGDPAPNFTFNLADRTYEEVLQHCRTNNVNLKRVTFVQGDRFFAERDYNEEGDQVWVEISSPSSVDVHQETAQLAYLDAGKKLVDWPTTLANLNLMIENKPYSENMMRTCLLRFVNHYEPQQTEYLKQKTCNEIANFLLSLNSRVDRQAYHKAKLHNSTRAPEETLSAALFKVKNIAEQIYAPRAAQAAAAAPAAPAVPAQQAGDQNAAAAAAAAAAAQAAAAPAAGAPANAAELENRGIINRILINAIISFTRDEIAIPLQAKVQADSALGRLLDHKHYLLLAQNAELRSGLYPTVPLKYSRKLAPGANSVLMLNSMQLEEIHPCMRVPKRAMTSRHLQNYFGHYGPQDEEEPLNIVNHFGNIPGENLAPHFQEVQEEIERVPGPNLPGPQVQVVPGPNQIIPALPRFWPEALLGATGANPRNILRTDVPAGAQIFDAPAGQYLFINGEFVQVQPEIVPVAGGSGTVQPRVTTSTPTRKEVKVPTKDSSDSESTSSKSQSSENEYQEIAELFSVMLQKHLGKPSGNNQSQPPRGNSRERQTDKRNDQGQNRPRTPSGDRNGYRPSARSDNRQSNNYPPRGSSNSGQGYNSRPNNYQSPNRGYPPQRGNSGNRDGYNSRSYQNNGSYNNNSNYRPRSNERSYSQERNNSGYNKENQNYSNRGNSNSRDYSPHRRDISRDRSQEARRIREQEERTSRRYPDMKKGVNCKPTYNPFTMKSCSKCDGQTQHHEFECRKYYKYCPERCTVCDKYYHESKVCKEVPKYPPKHADSNAISSNPN